MISAKLDTPYGAYVLSHFLSKTLLGRKKEAKEHKRYRLLLNIATKKLVFHLQET